MRRLVYGAVLALMAASPTELVCAAESREAARDGAHDFDFNIGTWHTHIRRQSKPLSGASEFIVLDGTVTVRKVWDDVVPL